MTVGLATHDRAVAQFGDPREAVVVPIVRDYCARAAALADRGASMTVLPEKFATLTPERERQARSMIAEAARARRVTIVAGFNLIPAWRAADSVPAHARDAAQAPRNTAVVFDQNGGVILAYDKRHLVPGLEAEYRPGGRLG
jgi:apolipoprotein N-acyltransferase